MGNWEWTCEWMQCCQCREDDKRKRFFFFKSKLMSCSLNSQVIYIIVFQRREVKSHICIFSLSGYLIYVFFFFFGFLTGCLQFSFIRNWKCQSRRKVYLSWNTEKENLKSYGLTGISHGSSRKNGKAYQYSNKYWIQWWV